jgi:hypothetical protein
MSNKTPGEIRLPYEMCRLPPGEPFPTRTGIYVPFVNVTICSGIRSVGPLPCILDSGANFCTIDVEYGKVLGLCSGSSSDELHLPMQGGTGLIWYHTIQMEVKGLKFECRCGFSDVTRRTGLPIAGILGREGFFSRFQSVTFEQRKETIVLRYRDADLFGPHV